MKYKTSSYLRSSAGGRPACWPGRLRDWEQDRRRARRSAGSEAIVMRAGPAGRLARASARRRTSPERRQSAPSTPAEGRQDISDASNLLKSIDFRALRLRRKKCEALFLRKVMENAAAVPLRRRRARAAAYVLFMCAPGGVFSRRQVFCIFGFSHTAPLATRAGFGKKAKQRKQQHMLMDFVFAIASCEQLWAQEIAEGQIVRNQRLFQEGRAAATKANRGCWSTGAA